MTGTIKISELNAAASLTGTEEVPIVAGGATKRTTTLAIANLASVSSGTITIGNTPISGGTNTRVLYDNNGFVGEYAISGTGSVVMTNSPTLVTPALGVPTSLTLTNATGLPVGGISATGTPSASTFLRGDGSWAAAGVGSVTSVAQTFTGGLISVSGSPITSSGTLALTVAGTSGGIPYFSSSSTWASSGALASTALVIGGGAGSAPTTSANLTFSSPALTIGVASTTRGQMVLANTTANSVTVQSSNSTSAAWTLTLPVDAGTSGYALITNGSGVTSWSAISASPGGSSGQVQYNNAGAFGGATGLTFSGGALATVSASGAGTFGGAVTTSALGGVVLGTANTGIYAASTSRTVIYAGLNDIAEVNSGSGGGFGIRSSSYLAWNSSSLGNTYDLFLARDAANTLALRNSTNAQTQRWYSTYTDGSNGAWSFLDSAVTTAATLTLGTSGNGTGASTLSKFQLSLLGTVRADYNNTVANGWYFNGPITCYTGSGNITLSGAGRVTAADFITTSNGGFLQNAIFGMRSDYALTWYTSTNGYGTVSTVLTQDAANTLALRNSTSNQTFRLYETFTDSSNYSRLNVYYNSATFAGFVLESEPAGTGTYRRVALSGERIQFQTGTTFAGKSIRWNILSDGSFTAQTDNTFDIGASGASRPRTGYFGTSLVTPLLNSTGAVQAYSGTAIPAGGTTGSGIKVSSTSNFGVFFGSGAPTLSAAKGSLYLRSDGSTTNDRAYINTDGSTTWTAVTTAA